MLNASEISFLLKRQLDLFHKKREKNESLIYFVIHSNTWVKSVQPKERV